MLLVFQAVQFSSSKVKLFLHSLWSNRMSLYLLVPVQSTAIVTNYGAEKFAVIVVTSKHSSLVTTQRDKPLHYTAAQHCCIHYF